MTENGSSNSISGRCLLLSLVASGLPVLIVAGIGNFEGLALLGLMVIWFGAAYLLARKCSEDEAGWMAKIFGEDKPSAPSEGDGMAAGWLTETRVSDRPEPAKTMSSAKTSGAISRLTGEPMDHGAPAPAAKPAPAPKAKAAPAPKPVEATPAPAPKPEPEAPKPAPAPAPAPADEAPTAVPVGQKPKMMEAARAEGPDDLKQIKGVGPKMEIMLNGMGIFHFDQIAAWSDAELAWVDDNLEGFKGRASRDEWIAQAKALAAD